MEISDMRLPPFRLIHAAYVTPDLEAGKRRLAAMYGIRQFKIYRDAGIEVPGGIANIDFALAVLDNFAFEAIHPKGGQDAVYRNALPSDPNDIAFHHFATRITSQQEWDCVLEARDKHGLDMLVYGDSDSLKYIYLDMRPHIGHILEYIWYCDPAAEKASEAMMEVENVE